MARRMFFLLLSLSIPAGLLGGLGGLTGRPFVRERAGEIVAATDEGLAVGEGVIVNEWSQGHGGSKEWVELLVTTGPIDLRGWNLGDNSAGDLILAEHSAWAAVMTGTLIVIYNGSDPDSVLPSPDVDDSDGVLVLAHDAPGYFDGSWPALSNSDSSDNPHLRDSSGQTIHDFSEAPGSNRHPEAEECTYYQGNTVRDMAIEELWANDAPAAAATPGIGNSETNREWITLLRREKAPAMPDLHLEKKGPISATAGTTIVYGLSLSNEGVLTATGVVITDVLPMGLTFISESSGLPLSRQTPETLVWRLGELRPGMSVRWSVTATVDSTVYGVVTNTARTTTLLLEGEQTDNEDSVLTRVESADGSATVLIDAVLYDGYEYLDADEAVRLRNVGATAVQMAGWRLTDAGSGTVSLPAGTMLAPDETLWLAKNGEAFRRQFGFAPGIAFNSVWPGFANNGDEVLLFRDDGVVVDGVVYKAGIGEMPWWEGSAVVPYTVPRVLPEEGQVLYRRLQQVSGQPVPDTDRESDWAQTRSEILDGRRAQYPGWSLERFFLPTRVTETAVLTVAIAPDNAYSALLQEIERAQKGIKLETLTFENIGLGTALAAAARRGVMVTVLLEGDPVGGITNEERYVCQQLAAAGGSCWFMIRDDAAGIQDRYRYLHAKFVIVDDRRVIVSSENMSPNSLPDDDKSDGTWGRRGVLLITNAPAIVARFQTIFADDFDPVAHHDLRPWLTADPVYGAPPVWFRPVTATGGTTYTVRFPQAATFTGTFAFEVLQAPENSLRDQDGLLGLLRRAGIGDTLLVEQLSERPHWGPGDSDPIEDPNPRLEAYLDAARRGARVHLLLDDHFDDEASAISNQATCMYVREVAKREEIPVRCALGNPTGLGIHNKMVLAEIGGQGWIHVGSLNGSEQAAKGNREVALQVQSNAAFKLLAQMFTQDWPHQRWFPVLFHQSRQPARHILISEVLYNPPGLDDAEFIELANPTSIPVDLSGWQLGDATDPADFEDVRRFPGGTVIKGRAPLVIGFAATAFRDAFGFNPDFEIYPSDPLVPDMIDEPTWGDTAAWLQLGNEGDEVILYDVTGQPVDILTYGTGNYPGIVAAPAISGGSLERYPPWLDSDNCTADFRQWLLPNPGELPAP